MKTQQRRKSNQGSQIRDAALLSGPGTEKKQQEYNNEEYKGKGMKRWAARMAGIVWHACAALLQCFQTAAERWGETDRKKGGTVSGQMFHLAQQPPTCSTKSWPPHIDFLLAQVGIHSKILPPSTLQVSNYFLLRFPKQDVARLFSNPQQITSPSTRPSQLSLNLCRLLTVNHCWQGIPWIYLLPAAKKIRSFFFWIAH